MKNNKKLITFVLLTAGLAVVIPLAMFLFLKIIASGASATDASYLLYALMFITSVVIVSSGIIIWKLNTIRKELKDIKDSSSYKVID